MTADQPGSNAQPFLIQAPRQLLKDFDQKLKNEGYSNRSEAIRTLMRAFIAGALSIKKPVKRRSN